MKHVSWLSVMIGILWLPAAALAQDASKPEAAAEPVTETVTEAEANTQSESTQPDQAVEENSSERPPDNYRPSEDISEDLGVSFPVDI